MKALFALTILALAATTPARADDPLNHDAMGPIIDVSAAWEDYQPSDDFCVTIDGFDAYTALSGDTGPTCEDDSFRVTVEAPPLCAGCARLFIDFSQIPENDPSAGMFYAHGHVFFRMHAFNRYEVDPVAHSPNIKNLTNDKAVNPEGSPQDPFFSGFDTYAIAYVGSTARTTHSDVQGPYYVGPRYVNAAGRTIHGAYVDVSPGDAVPMGEEFDTIRYWVGFNSGEATCPDNLSEEYADGNYGYYGCATHPAVSVSSFNPFA